MVKPSLHASLCACMYTHLSIHTRMMYYAGLLKPVSNLTVTHINSTTVLISWCPPFTLEGIPILGYNVTCTNMLYYSIDHPDSSFTVTVVPINEYRSAGMLLVHIILNSSAGDRQTVSNARDVCSIVSRSHGHSQCKHANVFL